MKTSQAPTYKSPTYPSPTRIYLNGLLREFPDKTPPLPPATYLYIMFMGLLRGTLPYGGFCSWGGETWAWEARGGGDHSMRSAKKIHTLIGVVLFVAVWRCEWQRFQTEEFLRSLNLARRFNIIFLYIFTNPPNPF